jgi:hypothetical protein
MIQVEAKMITGTVLDFQSRINPVMERASQSRFNGLPSIAITRDTELQAKLVEVQNHLMECKVLINLIGRGQIMDSDGIKKQVKKLEETNTLIAEILDGLEKKIY